MIWNIWNKGKSMKNYPQCGFQKGNKLFRKRANGTGVSGNKGKIGIFKHSEEFKQKLSLTRMKENNPMWKGGHQKNERNDSAYQKWVEQIKKRDKICQLKNENCGGYLVVHHIKPWRDYPELRYKLTNGITLCQAHHPRKWAEEIQIMPKLLVLVGNNV